MSTYRFKVTTIAYGKDMIMEFIWANLERDLSTPSTVCKCSTLREAWVHLLVRLHGMPLEVRKRVHVYGQYIKGPDEHEPPKKPKLTSDELQKIFYPAILEESLVTRVEKEKTQTHWIQITDTVILAEIDRFNEDSRWLEILCTGV